MKKRILSLVLALAMCLSVFTFGIAIEAAPAFGELMEIYKERVWEWQDNQFEAMTDEQTGVMNAAWASYENNKDAIRAEAEEFIDVLIDEENKTFFDRDTMGDLYRWKTMRDIMEGKLEITNEDDAYVAWLNDFTAFEEDNDEKITAAAPIAALNGLDDYSADLTEKFEDLFDVVSNGVVLEGEGAEKVNIYIKASLDENGHYTMTEEEINAFNANLAADVKELMVDGLVNGFDIGMQVATGEIRRGEVPSVLDMIDDRDLKAAFLIVGEDLVRYAMDELVPGVRGQFLSLNKKEIMAAVIGDATAILGGNNAEAIDALYNTVEALVNYMLDGKMPKIEEAETKLEEELGIVITEELVAEAKEKLQTVMGLVEENHGLELVHINTFLGRELLRYENEGEYVYLKDAVIDGDEVSELALGFGHNRYPVFSTMNDYGIASFDANYDNDGIKVYTGEDADIGQIFIEVTEEADGEATVNVYRGYTGEFDEDGNFVENVYDEDVYRYVTSFTVKATSDIVVEEPYVELEDVLDTTVDGTITVKGETNLDYVTVAIIKNGETIYAVVYSKAEFEAGITLNAPDNAAEGDVYTVVVGTDEASASDEFAIEGAEQEYEVVLNDVLDTTVDGTITVSGTTNLDYVTVAIVKNGETIYAVVYSKAEFEAGITLNAPDNAAEGEVYTVVVGTEKASASDEFTIVDETVDYEITLEDIADFKLSENENAEIVVKGTTNLEYVVVTITLGEDSVYAVTHTKAEFEAGITIAIDNAIAGNVYTVAVGQTGTEAEDTFEILAETPVVYEITLEDIADFKLSENENAEVVVKGTTNLEYVVVTITLGEDSVYAVTHTKAEFEAGITIAIDGAAAGNVYTVAVGQTGTEAEDTFKILEEVIVPVEPSLALAGKTTRTVTKGRTIDITTTPQNVPEGSTAEVVWTNADGEVIEVTATSGDSNNIATVKGLKKGTTTLTATLYVDGVATAASVTVTVKVTTGGGPGGKTYTNITVKVDETKDVVKVPADGTKVEFVGSGDGEVEVAIVDGVVVVTGVKVGEVKGTVKVTNDSGRTVLTGDYKFIVTEGDVVIPDHKCEWPDIAATETKDAHWAHETIDIMTINGYIKGYDDGTFKPDQNITRAEFSAIVYRILGLEVAEDGVLYDDTTGHWAEDIIATMSLPEGYGMLRGYGDGNFGPNDLITREQAVAIIARAKSAVWVEAEEGAKDVFTDAEDISWWFDGEMDAAVTNGLITGYQDGSYKPLNFTTRAEACVLLARAWPEVLE